MTITIKHGDGEALVRASGLATAIRAQLELDVALEPAAAGHLEVVVDGELIAWRHGGPSEHAMGLGWPDTDAVLAKIRSRRVGRRAAPGKV